MGINTFITWSKVNISIKTAFFSNLYIFPWLISARDIFISNELTVTMKFIGQCDIKYIMSNMTLQIKTITSVLILSQNISLVSDSLWYSVRISSIRLTMILIVPLKLQNYNYSISIILTKDSYFLNYLRSEKDLNFELFKLVKNSSHWNAIQAI